MAQSYLLLKLVPLKPKPLLSRLGRTFSPGIWPDDSPKYPSRQAETKSDIDDENTAYTNQDVIQGFSAENMILMKRLIIIPLLYWGTLGGHAEVSAPSWSFRPHLSQLHFSSSMTRTRPDLRDARLELSSFAHALRVDLGRMLTTHYHLMLAQLEGLAICITITDQLYLDRWPSKTLSLCFLLDVAFTRQCEREVSLLTICGLLLWYVILWFPRALFDCEFS